MGLHQFNKDKKLLKLKFNNNKNKYLKLLITMISIVLIVFTIVYFSYSKYTETNKYNVMQSTVGDFSKTKNLVSYLTVFKLIILQLCIMTAQLTTILDIMVVLLIII